MSMRVFFDGLFSEPRLDHPEGIAVASDGAVWCGGEAGQLYRIAPDGSGIEQRGSTGGFCLGLAFDDRGDLYACDLVRRAVFRLRRGAASVELVAVGFRIPNVPAFDTRGRLFVSDSHAQDEAGPGIWLIDGGGSRLWHAGPFRFANGLAFSPDGAAAYVAETFAGRITRIAIRGDGEAGETETVVELPGVLPDGLAFGPDGNLYVACYEPSQLLRVTPSRTVEVVAADPLAHTLCHPTNVAFRNGRALCSNLGRWHVTEIDLEAAA